LGRATIAEEKASEDEVSQKGMRRNTCSWNTA
jgi:hypothetical protein